MSPETIFRYIPLPLYLMAIALHVFGCFIIITKVKNRRNQDRIILNLSVAEICMACSDVTQNILMTMLPVHSKVIRYLTIIQCSMFVFPCFLIMITLTLDRFFEVFLNIRYSCFVTTLKMKQTLLICWCSGFMLAAVLVPLSIGTVHYQLIACVIYKYIFPITEGMFLVIAICSYAYIYNKFRQLNKLPGIKTLELKGEYRKIERRKRRVFAPFLIVLTFIGFVIIPDLANLMLFYVFKNGTNFHSNLLLICYALGFISDAVIYLFVQRHIKRHALRTLKGGYRDQEKLGLVMMLATKSDLESPEALEMVL